MGVIVYHRNVTFQNHFLEQNVAFSSPPVCVLLLEQALVVLCSVNKNLLFLNHAHACLDVLRAPSAGKTRILPVSDRAISTCPRPHCPILISDWLLLSGLLIGSKFSPSISFLLKSCLGFILSSSLSSPSSLLLILLEMGTFSFTPFFLCLLSLPVSMLH